MVHVSVVIASHNEGKNLVRTVQSCLDSLDSFVSVDHEIVVSDDASTDGSIEDLHDTFPRVRVIRSDSRRGASPAKNAGAEHARGDVLIFMDAHTLPENDAIPRLVRDVDRLPGEVIVTPSIVNLDAARWVSDHTSIGHGYGLDLETLECRWLELTEMAEMTGLGEPLYESPALIGCAFALSRILYDKLWGFDPHMRYWGVEDLDLGLKCWLLGHKIVHDPEIYVAHRFRERFDTYGVPVEHVMANQLRMAYKNLSPSVWQDWVGGCRGRAASDVLPEHPEGVWAQAWRLFDQARSSADPERRSLHGRREHDEFWYARRFGLSWPMLSGAAVVEAGALVTPSVGPSVGPSAGPSGGPPKCSVTAVVPPVAAVLVGQAVTFSSRGTNLTQVKWSAPGGQPSSGTGAAFTTRWIAPGVRHVTAGCGGGFRQSTVTVIAPKLTLDVPSRVTPLMSQQDLVAKLTPAGATTVATRYVFQIRRKGAAAWSQLGVGSSATFHYIARVAGHLQLRVSATVNGLPVTSAPVDLEVQFPSFAEITADASVIAFTDASWQSTLAATTPTTRREEGFWIQLDTSTGTYKHTAKILGPVVGPTQTGSVVLGPRSADIPTTPAPTATATYTVASFHTHTPTTFRTVGRPVGPSAADQAADTHDDVAGVVYDYDASPPGSGAIPAGLPLASPAHRYASGPSRRSTPA